MSWILRPITRALLRGSSVKILDSSGVDGSRRLRIRENAEPALTKNRTFTIKINDLAPFIGRASAAKSSRAAGWRLGAWSVLGCSRPSTGIAASDCAAEQLRGCSVNAEPSGGTARTVVDGLRQPRALAGTPIALPRLLPRTAHQLTLAGVSPVPLPTPRQRRCASPWSPPPPQRRWRRHRW